MRNRERLDASAAIRNKYLGHPLVGQMLRNYEVATDQRPTFHGGRALYHQEVAASHYRLLNPNEESPLAVATERGLATYDRLSSVAAPEPGDMRTFLGHAAASEVLFHTNQRLALNIVRARYGGAFQDNKPFLQDIASAALEKLLKAVVLFDYRQGVKFSTFAIYIIRKELEDYVPEQARTIRIPRATDKQYRTMRRESASLATALGREPTHREVTDRLPLNESEIVELYQFGPYALPSLDMVLSTSEETGTTLGEVIPDPRESHKPQSSAEQNNRAEMVERVLGSILSPKERLVTSLTYGIRCDLRGTTYSSLPYEELFQEALDSKTGLTRERIAAVTGITEIAVRRSLQRARDKFAEVEELQDFREAA